MRTRKEALGYDSGRMCFGKHLDKSPPEKVSIRKQCSCFVSDGDIFPDTMVPFTNMRLSIIHPFESEKTSTLIDGIHGFKCSVCNSVVFRPESRSRISVIFSGGRLLGRTFTKIHDVVSKYTVNDFDQPFSYDPFTIFIFGRSLSTPRES